MRVMVMMIAIMVIFLWFSSAFYLKTNKQIRFIFLGSVFENLGSWELLLFTGITGKLAKTG